MSGPGAAGRVLEGAIDAHVHYLPTAYRDGLAAAGITKPDGFPVVPTWSPAAALEEMDRLGIAASLLSISSPSIFLDDRQATADLARAVNDEGAEVGRANPDRFGFMVTLPLPDVGAALAELTRCYDELAPDGVGLMTNYQGNYLGADGHEELFAELDRRKAVVVLHPTSPPGWEELAFGRPRPMVEFVFDTTRTVFKLILDGVPQRYPGIRFVIPHVGSAIPSLVDRVSAFVAVIGTGPDDPPCDVVGSLQDFYWDVAGVALPRALPALLQLVGPGRLLYGSDAPFAPTAFLEKGAAELLASDVLDEEGRAAMLRGNALQLLPRFADR